MGKGAPKASIRRKLPEINSVPAQGEPQVSPQSAPTSKGTTYAAVLKNNFRFNLSCLVVDYVQLIIYEIGSVLLIIFIG